jgi:cytochrome c oxidase subunit 2
MRVISRICVAALLAVMAIAGAGAAWAGYGQPTPWQVGFQGAVTPVMDDIVWFHNDFLLWIITAITVFVLILLAIIVVRFNARAHPTPSRTTHNTLLELAWTLIPVLILMAIAIPSFKLLFFQLNTPPADLTVKATGKQWFWSYSYPDNGKFEYDSLMLKDDERQARLVKDPKADVPRLLSVDNELVVPVNKVVRVLVTGADVIHSWSVPSFGVKMDAIPGRINETWFKATREGMYYGQCSQLCGRDHAFMPIAVHVVSDQEFQAWLADAKKKYASDDTPPTVAVAVKSSKDTPTAVAAK